MSETDGGRGLAWTSPLSREMFRMLCNVAEEGMQSPWRCPSCESAGTKLKKMVEVLTNRVEETETVHLQDQCCQGSDCHAEREGTGDDAGDSQVKHREAAGGLSGEHCLQSIWEEGRKEDQ